MFKLSDLSQEQQIKVLLGLIVAFAVFAGFYFVALPATQRLKSEREELEQLQSQIERANALIDRESDSHEVLLARSETMSMISSRLIPPPENTFVWATELMYDYGRKLELDIDSINEVARRTMSWDSRDSESDRYFIPYQIRIELRCGFDQLKSLIEMIQKENPYASVSELNIVGQSNEPERHRININILWPIPKQTARKSIAEIVSLDFLQQHERGQTGDE